MGARAASTSSTDTPPPLPPLLLPLRTLLLLPPLFAWLAIDVVERGRDDDRGVARPLLLFALPRSWLEEEEEAVVRGGRARALELGLDRCAEAFLLLRFFDAVEEEVDESACSLDNFPYPTLLLSSTESEVFGRRERFAVPPWLLLLLPLLLASR